MEHMNIQLTEEPDGRLQDYSTALTPGTYDVRIRDAAHTACEYHS